MWSSVFFILIGMWAWIAFHEILENGWKENRDDKYDWRD